ncbi:hypothetical protein V5799_030773 [Amblyomma americanum]|uniref:Uncharacterized protein n=1 Tax=Amblyomma americanum TaxID=6943 RepID=A0AAQ4EM42_AMBAM
MQLNLLGNPGSAFGPCSKWRIEEGRYQHIVFSEWLPWQLGSKAMDEYDLWVSESSRTSYDDSLDATLSNEFSAGHFRYSHPNTVHGYWRIDEEGVNHTMLELKDTYFIPMNATFRPIDSVLRGSVLQAMKPFNRFGDHAVTHYLFRNPWEEHGDDLFAVDIQRGRDHGIRPYVDWVRHCQNIAIADFSDLKKVMPEEIAMLYAEVYE